MTFVRSVAAAVVAIGVVSPASANVIDLFDGTQAVGDFGEVGDGIDPTNQVSEIAAAVPGGFRELFVDNTFGGPLPAIGSGGLTAGTTLVVQNGRLSFSNADGRAGIGRVIYDGPNSDGLDAPGGSDPLGFDLSFGALDPSSLGFFFDITSGDGTFQFSATVTDVDGNARTFEEDIIFSDRDVLDSSISPFLPFLFFTADSDPTDAVDDGVDVTRARSVIFEISSDDRGITGALEPSFLSIDGSIGGITVVPGPATAFLLFGSVAGVFGAMGAAGRRRRREEA